MDTLLQNFGKLDDSVMYNLLSLFNEIRLNAQELNTYAARTNLDSVNQLLEKYKITGFDQQLMQAEAICSAVEFQQLVPAQDRNKLGQITTLFGKKLKVCL